MATQEVHDAPELAQSNFPEAVPQQQQYQYNQGQYQQPYQQYPPQNAPPKPEDGQIPASAPFSAYSGSQLTSPAAAGAVPAQGRAAKRKGTICGCSVLEFVLCTIIALLSAAVIGLAAGTGVEANRANTAEDRVAQLKSSLASATAGSGTGTATASSSTSTSTSYSDLDDKCSTDASGVTGTTYDAFSLFGNYTFTLHCNKDTDGDPLLSLFTANIDTCMDACASYDTYITDSNSTCEAISFIPLWTTKTDALSGGAPGNCYLKPSQTASLSDPNIGTECHAAVLTDN